MQLDERRWRASAALAWRVANGVRLELVPADHSEGKRGDEESEDRDHEHEQQQRGVRRGQRDTKRRVEACLPGQPAEYRQAHEGERDRQQQPAGARASGGNGRASCASTGLDFR